MTNLAFPVAPPQNGDDFDATPVAQLLNYLLGVLQAYDLSNVLAGSALDTLFAASNSPLQRFIDGFQSFVVGGGLPSGFTGLNYTIPAVNGATFQSNGVRVADITGESFTAAINSDTYVSIRSTGVINTPQATSNGGSQPALPTADSQWLCKIVSNGSTITSITDLRNLTPLSIPAPAIKTFANPGSAGGTMSYLQLGAMKWVWGETTAQTIGGTAPAAAALRVTFPPGLFAGTPTVSVDPGPPITNTQYVLTAATNKDHTGFTIWYDITVGAAGIFSADFIAIGV